MNLNMHLPPETGHMILMASSTPTHSPGVCAPVRNVAQTWDSLCSQITGMLILGLCLLSDPPHPHLFLCSALNSRVLVLLLC